jgi:hypothetical protein
MIRLVFPTPREDEPVGRPDLLIDPHDEKTLSSCLISIR